MGDQGIILTQHRELTMTVGVSLDIELPIGHGNLFPVYMAIEATAVKKFKGKREYELRRQFFHRITKIGNINKEKLLMGTKKTTTTARTATKPAEDDFDLGDASTESAFEADAHPTVVLDHPHSDLALISQRVGFKLPNVLPQDYAMCEVALEVSYITTKAGIEEESTKLLNRIGPMVMGQLDTLARECGGVPIFTAAEEEAAQVEADKDAK